MWMPGSTKRALMPAHFKAAVERLALSLNAQRISTVAGAVRTAGAKLAVHLGCGEGKLLRELVKRRQLERIVGMDVSIRSLETAHERLRLDEQ
jgi:predicted TPR repeat methyltransferase